MGIALIASNLFWVVQSLRLKQALETISRLEEDKKLLEKQMEQNRNSVSTKDANSARSITYEERQVIVFLRCHEDANANELTQTLKLQPAHVEAMLTRLMYTFQFITTVSVSIAPPGSYRLTELGEAFAAREGIVKVSTR